MAKQKLVVVGNGMAGARAVEEVLSRAGNQFEIVMFGNEPYGNYNRILLSNVLNGSQGADDILINPLDWYAENGVTLHSGELVVDIDRAAKVILTESGKREHYDKLLIATGSRAFIPPMTGAHLANGMLKAGVFGYRTLDDCSAILDYVKRSRRVVTIGGGLLGLEAARAMMVLGAESHIVHLAGHLMEMQLDVAGGAILRKAIEDMGILVHVKKLTTEVLGADKVTGLVFKDGETLDCDMVIVAAGIKPIPSSAFARVLRSSAPSWSMITCARSTTRTSMWSGNALSIAAACTVWSRHCGSRAKSSPTTSPAPTRRPPITVRSSRPS